MGEEFWSTTTIEVDPADLRGAIHTSAWDLDQLGVGSSHNLAESANYGNSSLNHADIYYARAHYLDTFASINLDIDLICCLRAWFIFSPFSCGKHLRFLLSASNRPTL